MSYVIQSIFTFCLFSWILTAIRQPNVTSSYLLLRQLHQTIYLLQLT
jgi:hypothetical protein